MNLDDLLASLADVAKDDLDKMPLLESASYSDPALQFKRDVESTAHIAIGALARWLHERGALVRSKTSGGSEAYRALSLTTISKEWLGGKLLLENISESLRAFTSEYVRTGAYGSDMTESLITAAGLTDMSEVPDNESTFRQIALDISERLTRYLAADAACFNLPTSYQKIELHETEKTPLGWKEAFAGTLGRDSLPERERRAALNLFWALVDYAPEIASREVVIQLLSTFTKSADSAVQQSVFNSLAAMPFAMVMTEIVNAAQTLEKSGWLPEILGSWNANFSDEQIITLEDLLNKANADQRNCIYRAAKLPDYRRSPWAMSIQAL